MTKEKIYTLWLYFLLDFIFFPMIFLFLCLHIFLCKKSKEGVFTWRILFFINENSSSHFVNFCVTTKWLTILLEFSWIRKYYSSLNIYCVFVIKCCYYVFMIFLQQKSTTKLTFIICFSSWWFFPFFISKVLPTDETLEENKTHFGF